MPPTPAPTPVEVFVHSGPAEWWQILAALGPLAVLLGAGIGGFFAWRTLKQKAEADNRSEWWKRTQWALDAVYSGDKKRGTVGLKVLKVLGESDLAGTGELAVLEAAWEKPLDEAARKFRTTESKAAASELATHVIKASDGFWEATTSQPVQDPGVDGEPGPRDNEEDQPGTTEGGPR